MKNLKTLAFWAAAVFATPVFGQNPNWENFRTDHYLQDLLVAEDRVFAATTGGIVELDPTAKSRVWQTPINGGPWPYDFWNLQKDPSGRVWAQRQNSFLSQPIWFFENGKWTEPSFSAPPLNFLAFKNLFDYGFSPTGEHWQLWVDGAAFCPCQLRVARWDGQNWRVWSESDFPMIDEKNDSNRTRFDGRLLARGLFRRLSF